MTLEQLIDHLKEEYGGLEAQGIFYGGKTVYLRSMPTHAARKKKRIYEQPVIKVLPEEVGYVDLVIQFVASSGETLEKSPMVRVHFK